MVSKYTDQTYSSIFLLELLLSVSHVLMVLSSSSLNGCVVDLYSLTRGEIITEIETHFHQYFSKSNWRCIWQKSRCLNRPPAINLLREDFRSKRLTLSFVAKRCHVISHDYVVQHQNIYNQQNIF